MYFVFEAEQTGEGQLVLLEDLISIGKISLEEGQFLESLVVKNQIEVRF